MNTEMQRDILELSIRHLKVFILDQVRSLTEAEGKILESDNNYFNVVEDVEAVNDVSHILMDILDYSEEKRIHGQKFNDR